MKILLAYRSYLPQVGGVWTYVDELKKGLEERGHSVDVLACHPSLQKYYILYSGRYIDTSKINSYISPVVNSYYNEKFPGIDGWIRKLEINRYCFETAAAFMGLQDYDIIHAQCVISALAMSRVKPKETPLVTTIHSSLINEIFLEMGSNVNATHHQYIGLLEHLGPISSDQVIIPSQSLKNTMKEFNIPDELMTVLPYGIDVAAFNHKMKQISDITKPENKKVIICPARLVYEKGHVYLIKALEKLKEKRSDWICWIVGDGECRSELEKIVKNSNLQKDVLFMGNRLDVPALLKKADIIVLPSLLENLPFAVMEAQLAGKAVIATNAGGLPEMINNNMTGFICEKGNSDEIYLNLIKLLNNESLLQQIGINAQQWALKKWTIEGMVSRVEKIYQSQLNTSKKGTESKPHKKVNTRLLRKREIITQIKSRLPDGYSIPDCNVINAFKTDL